MNDRKSPTESDLTALAASALDLWQDQLTVYAVDPAAKTELMRMMEPARQWFAEWAAMMQHGLHGANIFGTNIPSGGIPGSGISPDGISPGGKTAAARPTAAGGASDDGALGVAQLAYHVATLEKRVAELEQRLAKCEASPKSAAKPAKRAKS
jgi:hypothetical protein